MGKRWWVGALFLALGLGLGAGVAGAHDPESPSPEPLDELELRVYEIIGERLGVDPAEITADTDLVTDLGADPMVAFEILVLICEEEGVVLPDDSEMTGVGDIVEWVREGPLEEPAIIFRGGGGGGADEEEVFVQRVFYGTDRRLDGAAGDTDGFYSGARSEGGRIHYGTCEVTIPVSVHSRGQLERPKWWKFELREDPKKHVVLQAINPMNQADFLALVDSTLADSPYNPQRDVLVFVHGFNVTFAAAARRTAQMTYDLEFAGVPVFFSWPSDGRLASYVSDREDVEWSVIHLEKFLTDLRTRTQAGRIHLIAHSMGNQAIIRALYLLALRNGVDGPLFENIVMAAPDFDANRFVDQIAETVVPLARRWTLYASEKDFALDISTSIAAKRLGLPLAVALGVDTVDASGVDVAPWSVPETHGYFSSKQRVIQDLKSVLAGVAPESRALIRKVLEGRPYWMLKPVER